MEITDFITTIKAIGSKKGFENYYRGHSDNTFKLVPKIYRQGLIDNEDNIFKEAIIRTPHEFLNCKSTVEKLVKMQHYGVPTRLLDITSNPLVALYFACNKDKDKNGEVVFLQIPNDHIRFYDSDTVSVLANVSKRPANFTIDTSAKSIPEFNETSSIQYLIHEIKEEKSYFQNLVNPKHLEDVFVVKVKLDNPRILHQSGAFLIFGIYAKKELPAEVSWDWVLNKTEKCLHLTIPFNEKDKILKDLSLIGINQSSLFPEIENQGQHLIETYKK